MKKMKHNVPKVKQIITNYIVNNSKEFIIISLLFITGIFIGVLIINNCNQTQGEEINKYITEFIEKFKNIEQLDNKEIIINSIKNNIILTITIWVAGTTVIGVPIVLAVIFFRGMCLGYTISAIVYTFGKLKGMLFCIVSLAIQNMLFIPAILSLGVSSIKLYKSIIKDKRKDNIKLEIIRHTIFSALMLVILVISSFIENIISVKLLQNLIKFF